MPQDQKQDAMAISPFFGSYNLTFHHSSHIQYFMEETLRTVLQYVLGSNPEVFLDEIKCYAQGHEGHKEPWSGVGDHPNG